MRRRPRAALRCDAPSPRYQLSLRRAQHAVREAAALPPRALKLPLQAAAQRASLLLRGWSQVASAWLVGHLLKLAMSALCLHDLAHQLLAIGFDRVLPWFDRVNVVFYHGLAKFRLSSTLCQVCVY